MASVGTVESELTVVLDDLGHGPQISRLEAGELAFDFAPAPLFRLNFRSIVSGFITPIEPGIADVQLPTAEAIQGGLQISWGLCGPSNRLLLTAVVRIEVADDHLDLSIRVDAKIPQYSLYEVIFPILRVLPIGDPSTNVLALPTIGGSILRDPIHAAAPPQREFPLAYLGLASMQFFAYYVADGPLLFMQATDGEGFPKMFEWTGEPIEPPSAEGSGTTRFQTHHYPIDNAFEGNDVEAKFAYDMPYRIRLALMKGNWYDAAKRYRAWALQQKWARRGRIDSSPDFPSSLRTIDLGLLRTRFNEDQFLDDYEIYLEDARRLSDFLDTRRIAVLWRDWQRHRFDTSWPDFTVRPSAIEAIARARAEGFLVNPYTLMTLWDLNARSFSAFDGPSISAKDNFGNLRLSLIPDTGAVLSTVNFSRESTRALILDIWRRLATEIPCDGYYLDVFGGAPTLDQDASLPESGGTHLWEAGKRAFASLLRDTFKRKVGAELLNPDFFFTAEFGEEFLLDLMDVTGNAPFRAFRDQIQMPLYEVVYHEFKLTAESLISLPGVATFGDLDSIAGAFHAGRFFAFISWETAATLLSEPVEDTAQFELWQLVRTIVTSHEMTRRYQRFGERLRALPGSVEDMLDRGPVLDRSVQSSVWQSEADIGVLFTNTSDGGRPFSVEMSAPTYPIVGPVGVVQMSLDGSRELLGLFVGTIKLQVAIDPRSLILLEIFAAEKAIEVTVGTRALQIGPMQLRIDDDSGILAAELIAAAFTVREPGPFTFQTLVTELELAALLKLVVDTSNDGATWRAAQTSAAMQVPGIHMFTVDSIPGVWLRVRYTFTYGQVIGLPAVARFFTRLPDKLAIAWP